MKFNWGHGIALFFIVFVAFMLSMAMRMQRENIDLVAEDYYKQEVEYGDRMNEINRASALPQKLKVEKSNEKLIVTFPAAAQPSSGELHLFRPSDKVHDRSFSLDSLKGRIFELPIRQLMPGFYRLKISWEANKQQYYHETTCTL